MKKLLFILGVLFIYTTSFSQTAKKVILEDFTGTWCGWCPEGTVKIEDILSTNPTNFLPVASHNGDQLQVAEGAAVDTKLNVTSYPNAAIDRTLFSGEAKVSMSRSKWSNYVSQRLATTSNVSVSFSNFYKKKVGTIDSFYVTVNVKFTAQPSLTGIPLSMNVYILEDSIPATGAYAQSNYSTAVQSGASPLTNWYHNETLRKGLGGNWGYTSLIPATPVIGTVYSQTIGFTTNSTWKLNNLKLIAFVAYNGTDPLLNHFQILNAEKVSMKNFWYLGVNDANLEFNNVNIYPNPYNGAGVVNVEYNLSESNTVKMNVFDALGRIVDNSFESKEVAGTHTILWSPKDKNLPKGLYYIQLTANNSSKMYKLNYI